MKLFIFFILNVLITALSVSALSGSNETADALSLKALSGRWLSLNSPKNADGTPYYKNASCYSASYQFLNISTLLYVEQFNLGSTTGPLTIGDGGFLLKGFQAFNLTVINQFPHHVVGWQNVPLVGPLNTVGVYSWSIMEWPSGSGLSAWSFFVRDLAYFQNGSHASELQKIANFTKLNISSLIVPSEFEGCEFNQSIWGLSSI
jgi:hypothetical protein